MADNGFHPKTYHPNSKGNNTNNSRAVEATRADITERAQQKMISGNGKDIRGANADTFSGRAKRAGIARYNKNQDDKADRKAATRGK
jgi:hypothetical protein